MKERVKIAAMVIIALAMVSNATGDIIYVDDDASGANDGSSWADSFNYLQNALAVAQYGDEIHVAQGIYKPDQGAGITPSDPTATFQLKNGVAISGGYAGFGEPNPDDRNITAYETILSGDLAGNDSEVVDPRDFHEHQSWAENSWHLVTGSGTDATAVLDGFTITGGYALGPSYGGYYLGGGMYNYTGSPTVRNCVFHGNKANIGGGMCNTWHSNPTLSNCRFTSNSAHWSRGGGMYIGESNPTLKHCLFSGNWAGTRGGGIYCDGPLPPPPELNGSPAENDLTVTNCTFISNSADSSGEMLNFRSYPTLTNCVFSGNSAKYEGGGIFYSQTSTTMTNCTFAGNAAPNGNTLACDSYVHSYPSNVELTNCILWDGAYEIYNRDDSTINITYSDVQGGWTGEGNINADPCFVEPGYWDTNGVWFDGDYHLLSDSPCIDAGDPAYVAEPNETDLDSKPRIIGGRIDMGTFEYQPRIIYVDDDATGANDGKSWTDSYNDLQDALAVAAGNDEIRVAQGVYTPAGPIVPVPPSQASNPNPSDGAKGISLTAELSWTAGSKAMSHDVYFGTSSPLPFVSRQILTVFNAVNLDPNTTYIWRVDEVNWWGTTTGVVWRFTTGEAPQPPPPPPYPTNSSNSHDAEVTSNSHGAGIRPDDRTATFQLINGVTIKGGYAGFGEADPNARDIGVYETILSGDLQGNDGPDFANNGENSYNLVTISGTDETAVLDGFTITGGNGNGPYSSNNDKGGGMYIDSGSPTVINCTFSGNFAFDGGGMYIDSGNPTVTNCTFLGNSAEFGGGINNQHGSPKVIDCKFTRNSAIDGGGIAIDWHCAPSMTNCTFTGNSAEQEGGAIYIRRSTLRLTNCLFTGNSSSYGAGIYSYQSEPILTNCTFIGNTADIVGGGMCNSSFTYASMTNCVFIGNSAAFYGGGIINWPSISVLINCTLIGNSAGRCGGGIYHMFYLPPPPPSVLEAPSPLKVTITSCILWDNSNSEICGGPVDATFSDIKGGLPGQGNIDADPCFVNPGYWDTNGVWFDGDYHLLAESPCIDAGDPNYVAEPNETDLDGRPRVIGGRIDMGAYEYSPPIMADVRIVPRTINLQSKGEWITGFIQMPEDYDMNDIDANSVYLEGEIKPEQFWLAEDNQIAIARFSREEVQAILTAGEVELTITGQLKDGISFEGRDVVRVIGKGRRKN